MKNNISQDVAFKLALRTELGITNIEDSLSNDYATKEFVENENGFVVKQLFNNFTGTEINVTTESLPDNNDNIMLYVGGILLTLDIDYTVIEDTITLLNTVTNVNISIIWFLDKTMYISRKPSTISDFRTTLIGRSSLVFLWSCGGAYANQGIVDEYIIYYSKREIDNSNYQNAKSIKIIDNIGSYGVESSISVGSLDSDTTYYSVIVGVKGDNISELSNVAAFRTESTVLPANIGGYIKLNSSQVIDHHRKINTYYNTNGDLIYGTADKTIDGVIIEENNAPSSELSELSETFKMSWTGYKKYWDNFTPYELVYDLGNTKKVSDIFIHILRGTSELQIATSLFGADYVTIDTLNILYSDWNIWTRVSVSTGNQTCRYVKLSLQSVLEIDEVSIFGSDISEYLPVGSKSPNTIPKKSFENFVGCNVFLTDVVEDWSKFGSTHRIYTNWQWFTSLGIAQSNDVRLTDNEGGTNIEYFFDDNRIIGNIDEKLNIAKQSQLNDYGLESCVSMVDIKNCMQFMYLKEDNTVEDWSIMSDYKTVDGAMYTGYTNNEDPMSYRFAAQFAFAFTARYGRTTGHDESLLKLSSTNSVKQGLDLVKYFQWGNEPNKEWEESYGYHNPYEYAAMMSAIYDGHKGALGAGFGVKTADSTMQVVVPGLTGQNLDYIRRAIHWWDTHRGIGDYPLDVFNLHYYHNTTGGQTVNVDRKGLSPDGLNPVKLLSDGGTFYDVMKHITDWRDIFLPNMEFWLGESGYDQHPLSPQAPQAQEGRSLGLLKSDFLMRIMMHVCAANVDGFTQYMYRNDLPLDQASSNGYTNLYTTSGYVDNLSNADPYLDWGNIDRYPPLDSYYYIRSLIVALTGMRFSHVIRISEETHVDDILLNIEDLQDTNYICAIAFTSVDGGKSAIVTWVGTEQDTETNLEVEVDDITAEVTTFRGVEITESEVGVTNVVNCTRVDGKNILTIPVNGTPKIIWTDNIKSKALIPPILNNKVIDSTTARLYWDDKNQQTTDVNIYSYNNITEEYDLFYTGNITTQYYDITGLSAGSTYKYIMKFIDAVEVIESSFSNVTDFKCPDEIDAPTNLTQTTIGYDRITFSFDYLVEDEVNISGFIVYKSDTPTGVYNEISRISNNIREFTNYGLSENVEYYYKIQAYNEFTTSQLSTSVGITTLEANLQEPILLSAKTDYGGTRVSLFFDINLSSSIILNNNITVYEDGATDPIKSVINSEYEQSTNRLSVYLDSLIESSGSTLSIGYDGEGVLNSVWDVGVAQFSGYTVTNLKNSDTLISSKVQISYNGDSVAETKYEATDVPDGESWNNYILISGTKFLSSLIDSNNEIVGIVASTPRMSLPTPSIPYGATLRVVSGDDGNFPSYVKSAGMNLSEYMNYDTSVRLGFHGLDPIKKYSLEIFVSRIEDSNPCTVESYINLDINTSITKEVSGNILETILFESISPTTDTLPNTNDGIDVPLWDNARIFIDMKLADDGNRYSGRIGGVILTEYINESY